MSPGRGTRSSVSAAASQSRDRTWGALCFACGVLFLARFFVPAESAEEGETLWIVALWMGLATGAAWIGWREGRFAWRPAWPEAALGTLVFAQVAAAVAVVLTTGDARSAINMLWEWTGVLVAFSLLRTVAVDRRTARRLTGVVVTAGIVLAGLGVWQRFVWYPEIRAAYLEWEQLSAQPVTRGVDRQRMEELQRELGPELLALQGSSKAALRQRILDSREPFGRFALTNTFGGILAAVLVLLGGCWPVNTAARRVGLFLSSGLVALTLILTRSRTAWLACLCGLGFNAAVRRSASSPRGRGLVAWALFAALGLSLLLVLAILFGAVDRQDLTEAPKSVQYRLQYWTGTWPVILEHPWLGVGPGNFRQHYLRHKLPEASEEIADPHNLFLDVWTSGGILALGGLLWLGVLAGRIWMSQLRLRPGEPEAEGSAPAPFESPADWKWLSAVGVVTCALVFAIGDTFAGRTDRQLLWIAPAWIAAAWIVDRLLSTAHWSNVCSASTAAGLALTIHLLTSGGIAMPTVTLLLLSLIFVLPRNRPVEGSPAAGIPQRAAQFTSHALFFGSRSAAATAIIAAVLLVGCLWTGWGPVTLASLNMSAGSAALLIDRRPEPALKLFEAATKFDPHSSAAWRELALAHTALWQREGLAAPKHFEAAVDAVREAIARNPFSPHLYRLQGDLWLRKARQSREPDDARQAALAYEEALARYPTSSILYAELSRAWADAGERDAARKSATESLRLDDINRAAGHYDRTFTEEERTELRHLASS